MERRSGWQAEVEHIHPRWFILGIFALLIGLIWLLLDFNPFALLLASGGAGWVLLALLGHHARGKTY